MVLKADTALESKAGAGHILKLNAERIQFIGTYGHFRFAGDVPENQRDLGQELALKFYSFQAMPARQDDKKVPATGRC